MTDIAEIDFAPPGRAVAVSDMPHEAGSILNIIERAARDESVDIDKMERLILMQERVQDRQAQIAYDHAMQLTQGGMDRIRADASNPQTHSKYASYAALDRAVRPIYSANGFSLSFDTAEGAPDNCVRIVCRVAHSGGHRERHHIDMPADGKGAKGGDVMTRTHAMGSAATYGRRYLVSMVFNIAIGSDDDGNGAGGSTGSAGAGGDFRPDGPRRPWAGRVGSDEAIDEAERDGLTGKKVEPPKKATKPTPAEERATKLRAITDKRIDALKAGAGQWTRASLSQFLADEATWCDWMQDPSNQALAEYERFEAAYADAELNAKEVA